MHRFLLVTVWISAWLVARAAEPGQHRFLYLSTPDGAQSEGGSGAGILIFDLDHEHRFVRRIDLPVFKEGLRGFCGNAQRHCVYYSTTNRRLGCFDLESEKVLWEQQYGVGCDRSSVTLAGDKLYVPSGWWRRGDESGLMVVDGNTGRLLKTLRVFQQAHNSLVSVDGKFVYLGSETNLTVFRTSDESVVRSIRGVGEVGVFPFTVDSRNRFAYVCLGQHVGSMSSTWTPALCRIEFWPARHRLLDRTHGAALPR